MQNVSPLLALLALLAVGIASWLLGARAARRRSPPLARDYYRGLDHLLNDRLDSAVESFSRLAERDGDTIEIQFALGTLFRRRGEFDRAIALHERLVAAALPISVRHQARHELALDFLAAGLMDRAERLLTELAAVAEYREIAADRLMQLYAAQSDWANALRMFHELPASARQERRALAVHFLCELAELALVQADYDRVMALLREAGRQDASSGRVPWIAARLADACGDPVAALAAYVDAVNRAPDLLLEVVPRVRALTGLHGAGGVAVLRGALEKNSTLTSRQLDLAFSATGERELDARGRYSCEGCGLQSAQWFWCCPSCREWDRMSLGLMR
jgi:lipopolysaccharide biosynthesis regulator YciM